MSEFGDYGNNKITQCALKVQHNLLLLAVSAQWKVAAKFKGEEECVRVILEFIVSIFLRCVIYRVKHFGDLWKDSFHFFSPDGKSVEILL